MKAEREKEIRDSIRIVDVHPKYSKFRDPLKQMIIELLEVIDELRNDSGEDEDSKSYQDIKETLKSRDQLKTVLKKEIKNDAVNKFINKEIEK